MAMGSPSVIIDFEPACSVAAVDFTRGSVVAREHLRCSSALTDGGRSSNCLLLTSLYNPPLLHLLSGEH